MHRNRPDAALAPLVAALVILASPVSAAVTGQAANLTPSVERMTAELVAAHGEAQRGRIARGLEQVTRLWRAEDGDAASFEEFTRRSSNRLRTPETWVPSSSA
jgi:hypothetical protein